MYRTSQQSSTKKRKIVREIEGKECKIAGGQRRSMEHAMIDYKRKSGRMIGSCEDRLTRGTLVVVSQV